MPVWVGVLAEESPKSFLVALLYKRYSKTRPSREIEHLHFHLKRMQLTTHFRRVEVFQTFDRSIRNHDKSFRIINGSRSSWTKPTRFWNFFYSLSLPLHIKEWIEKEAQLEFICATVSLEFDATSRPLSKVRKEKSQTTCYLPEMFIQDTDRTLSLSAIQMATLKLRNRTCVF